MRYLWIFLLCVWPVFAWTQDQEEADKGFLTNLLENSLSAENQTVTINGFEGALSSQARIASLTIADNEGVWLRLEDAVLNWNRAALLRGAIDVTELSAKRLIVDRGPIATETVDIPDAEAKPFSLPELPVSVVIEALAIEEFDLGEVFLGEAIKAQVTGSANLVGGEGSLKLSAERLDGRIGRFLIDGAYSNVSKTIDLTADLNEGPEGIVAGLLGLPGEPSVEFQIEGSGPVSDFEATLTLGTDGAERLSGALTLKAEGDRQLIDLDVGGDITSLFAPDYQDFFGPNLSLIAEAERSPSGEFLLDRFWLSAQHVTLSGAARINDRGWPEVLDFRGQVLDPTGAPVLLPIAGTPTFISGLDLALIFNSAISNDWSVSANIKDLEQADLKIEQVAIEGGGILSEMDKAFTTDVTYLADGISLDDAALLEAMGRTISGGLKLERLSSRRLSIDALTIRGPGLQADATALIDLADGVDVDVDLALDAEEIARFQGLVGRDISGAADLKITGGIRPLDGIFDLSFEGETRALAIGEDRLDPVLGGLGKVSGRVSRDTSGSLVNDLIIRTDAASITADFEIASSGGSGRVDAELVEIGLVEPSLSGPISITATADQGDSGITQFNVDADGPSIMARVEGTANPTETGLTANITARLESADLDAFSTVAGRDLGGAATVNAVAFVAQNGAVVDAKVSAQTSDLKVGQANLDRVFEGQGQITADMSRLADATLSLKDLRVETDDILLSAAGTQNADSTRNGTLDAQIFDAGAIFPGLSGPVVVDLDAAQSSVNDADLNLSVTGNSLSIKADITASDLSATPLATGTIDAEIGTLAAFADVAGRDIAGALVLNAAGGIRADLSDVDMRFDIATTELRTGIATMDRVLAGRGTAKGEVKKSGDDLSVQDLAIATDQLNVTATVDAVGNEGTAIFRAALKDIGIFTDTVSGPMTVNGSADRRDALWSVDVTAIGPEGISATTTGTISDQQRLDLNISGIAPLGLANAALEPRRLQGNARFDLSVRGPAALDSVSGTISTSGTRLVIPSLAQALEDITGQISLNSGTATVDLNGSVPAGGTISLSGPVALSSPFNADLKVAAQGVVLQDPKLYQATVDGSLAAAGPLAGGARISGDLRIGETEVRVPSSSVGVLGELPKVTHVAPPAAVRQTLARAGVEAQPDARVARAGRGPDYPVNIVIRAPSRIFVRGRGLDAELGGKLTIGGTSRNLIPTGKFDLIRGRLNILRQRFDLTEGSASLQGNFQPFLRLVAQTEAETGSIIEIVVEGPANAPEVVFQSSPELPQDEVLAQLIFGRNLSEISPLQAVQLASAISTLAGRGGGALDSFRESLGLADLDVTTDEDGNAAVRAGAYISENIYTDVVVGANGASEINLNLDLTNNITAKGTVEGDGETSIGIFFEKDY